MTCLFPVLMILHSSIVILLAESIFTCFYYEICSCCFRVRDLDFAIEIVGSEIVREAESCHELSQCAPITSGEGEGLPFTETDIVFTNKCSDYCKVAITEDSLFVTLS